MFAAPLCTFVLFFARWRRAHRAISVDLFASRRWPERPR
jgi:hypothetical protein